MCTICHPNLSTSGVQTLLVTVLSQGRPQSTPAPGVLPLPEIHHTRTQTLARASPGDGWDRLAESRGVYKTGDKTEKAINTHTQELPTSKATLGFSRSRCAMLRQAEGGPRPCSGEGPARGRPQSREILRQPLADNCCPRPRLATRRALLPTPCWRIPGPTFRVVTRITRIFFFFECCTQDFFFLI